LQEQLFRQLHTDWQNILADHRQLIGSIETRLLDQNIAPSFENIFRALSQPPSTFRVVIFGQDPYPGVGQANGLAFSVEPTSKRIPGSLRNIFKELVNDMKTSEPENGDLSRWSDQGVLLLNRVLSTDVGSSLTHKDLGWLEITDSVARYLGQHDVVAILWGKNAAELEKYFRPQWRISSAHPSPLSAYRGFFGSKPFSRANSILLKHGLKAINW